MRLLAAAALAAGVLTGWLRRRQEDVGALHGCVSLDGTLYLSTSGKDENIVARVNPRTQRRAGQAVKVAFDTTHLHFFDKETETTLLTR